MDNAWIHHSPKIEDLVCGYGRFSHYTLGCHIEYLPPYSSDYNPIEQAFWVIKSHLHHIGIAFYPQHLLYYKMYQACQFITPEKTYGMFEHSEYAI
jgi:transposase